MRVLGDEIRAYSVERKRREGKGRFWGIAEGEESGTWTLLDWPNLLALLSSNSLRGSEEKSESEEDAEDSGFEGIIS